MPIDNATPRAKVGMFYALKPLLKSKSSTRDFSEFFSLSFFFGTILLPLNVHLFFSCIITKKITSNLLLLNKLPKMAKITIFLFLCFPNLLFRCADYEANTGPNYSYITFCYWNLNGRTAHDSIKISLLQVYIYNPI